ncbi:MAG TPA: M28 family peptidase [Ktedonobacteraceae bacterium]|nr:M28 family peptidase [Ktedonobacteraceae bacterium]
MVRRIMQACCSLLLATSFLLPAISPATTSASTLLPPRLQADFPTVDPDYIYNQLFYMVTHYLHREAGYDTNLPPNVNGHDEFAAYWAQEMVRDLQGFDPQVVHDSFPIQGWEGRPAKVPAFNVEVSVPGALHPEQVVVIGCHYDAEADSTQSANDDGSGCAIELGVAQALGNYWRSHHLYPARTLRFVIFDAEEQGLFGSFHYVNSTVNGDLSNIVAMFNEEQSGIAYPLRYLGKLSNPLLPSYIDMSPLQNNSFYPHQNQLSTLQRANITRFRSLMQQAIPAVFQQFQVMGYKTLTYRGSNGQPVSQPVFSSDQISNMKPEDDTLGGSDQIPFTLAGIPCATFAGNSTYYDRNPPPWSYPFDQPQDTIQLMNTFASGSSQKAPALVLALALPGMLTTWMLQQPQILGEVPATSITVQNAPVAAIADIGQTQVGKSLTFSTQVNGNSSAYSYAWNFGDGSTGSGPTVSHTYKATGAYTLALTITSATGSRRIVKTLNIVQQPTTYPNPYAAYPSDGYPPHNPQVILPTPDNSSSVGSTTPVTPPAASSAASPPVGWFIALGLLIVLLAGGVVVFIGRRQPRV